ADIRALEAYAERGTQERVLRLHGRGARKENQCTLPRSRADLALLPVDQEGAENDRRSAWPEDALRGALRQAHARAWNGAGHDQRARSVYGAELRRGRRL